MNKDNQTTWTLKQLMRGRKLTSNSAWTGRGITRLADIIFRLRGKGWNIHTTKLRSLDGGFYGEYRIPLLADRKTGKR